MTIFITGAAGFIGSNFVINHLANSDEPVIAFDKLTYAGNINNFSSVLNNKNFLFFKGDINNLNLVNDLLQEFKPRTIINFAAETHVDRSINSPEIFIKTNVVGTFKLLEATRLYLEKINLKNKNQFRFLHISTDEVFGSLKLSEKGFNENNQYLPNSPYSASKASSDHLVRAWFKTYDIPVITTNCSNNYGPFQFPEKLIPLSIYNAINNKKIPLYGDGQQIRDWLYVLDHCDAINSVLENGKIGETYNIGGETEKTNLEVLKTLTTVLDELIPKNNKSYNDQIIFIKDRPGHDRRYSIDAKKLQSELGWYPKESFSSGIYKTVQWYLENLKWVEDLKLKKRKFF